jgi:pilus assembly protein CpaB
MNRRFTIVILCALIVSASASYAVYRLTDGGRRTAYHAPIVRLVTAARNLEIGALIHEADLRVVEWAGPVPNGAATTKTYAINRGVISAIYVGEPITENRLAPVGSGGGLAATIPPGMRACAVKVNDVVGVGGFVTPGMRVDVLITGVPPGAATGAGPAVKTILQNIEVLSAGTNIDKDKEGKPAQVQVVNLLVNPHQAETLSLAGNETRIQLVLRNPMDTEITSPPGSYMSDLFDGARPRVSARPTRLRGPVSAVVVLEPPRRSEPPVVAGLETVDVFNGAARTVAKFPKSGDPQ